MEKELIMIAVGGIVTGLSTAFFTSYVLSAKNSTELNWIKKILSVIQSDQAEMKKEISEVKTDVELLKAKV